jgi:hypothetical protein
VRARGALRGPAFRDAASRRTASDGDPPRHVVAIVVRRAGGQLVVGFAAGVGCTVIRYKSFHYQADSWTMARRLVAKVEHHAGELFPRVSFIVTNLTLPIVPSYGSITSGAPTRNGSRR